MKKIILIITLLFSLAACKIEENIERYVFESMGTVIEVNIYDKDNKAYEGVEDIYELYSQLTSNFRRNEVKKDSPYYNLENIYAINLNAGVKSVTVRKELIELLKYSIELHEDTNGYFNIGIGHIVDKWKNLIDNNIFVLKDEYLQVLDEVNNLEEVDLSKIVIDEVNNTVYLTDDTVKIDLGAIAKGYATQKAYDYLKGRGIKRFKIVAGGSSISAGLHKEKRKFKFGLKDDNQIYKDNIIGIIKTENKHLSTSGTDQQYVNVFDNGEFYTKIHHIVSPFTLKPENNYYKISLLGDDAGLLDAYSTVIFLMDEQEIVSFLEDKDIGYVLYLFDKSVVTNLDEETFEQHNIVKGNN